MDGVVFLRVEACQLWIQQRAGPQHGVVPETVPQHINGFFNLFLHQQLFRRVIEQGKLHVPVGGHQVNGGEAEAAQRLLPAVMLPEQFHGRLQDRSGGAAGIFHFLLP